MEGNKEVLDNTIGEVLLEKKTVEDEEENVLLEAEMMKSIKTDAKVKDAEAEERDEKNV